MVATQCLSVFIIGISIGWLSGLSVSPVIAAILASLLGIAGGLVGGLNVLSKEKSLSSSKSLDIKRLNAIPVALLSLGIAIGAPLGVMARTYHVLEPKLPLTNKYDLRAKEGNISVRKTQGDQGVLFSVDSDVCADLLRMADHPNERAFRIAMKAAELPRVNDIVDKIEDTKTLKNIVREICDTN